MRTVTRLTGPTYDVRPGMAHFANTGPVGKTCGSCRHFGYWRPGKKPKFNTNTQQLEDKRVHVNACREYLRLSMRHGPPVEKSWPACKYWEALKKR